MLQMMMIVATVVIGTPAQYTAPGNQCTEVYSCWSFWTCKIWAARQETQKFHCISRASTSQTSQDFYFFSVINPFPSLRASHKMIFKVSAIFAVATLAGVANAEGERFCNGSVDPADCSDLAGLCGNALISGKSDFPKFPHSDAQSWEQTNLRTYTLVGVGGNATRVRSGTNMRASTALKRVGGGSRQRSNDSDSKSSSRHHGSTLFFSFLFFFSVPI